jgi:hypothetical protein
MEKFPSDYQKEVAETLPAFSICNPSSEISKDLVSKYDAIEKKSMSTPCDYAQNDAT